MKGVSIAVLLCLLAFVVRASAVSSALPPCSASWTLQLSDNAALNVQVDAWGVDSARVRIAPTGIVANPQPQALTAKPPSLLSGCTPSPKPSTIRPSPGKAVALAYGNLAVEVSDGGLVTVSRLSPAAALLRTSALTFAPMLWTSSYYKPTYAAYYSLNWTYSLPTPGLSYALGEHHHGREELPYRDFNVSFDFSETAGLKGDVTIPWAVHSSGFGVLWNMPGFGSYTISNGSVVSWTADASPQFDAFFTTTPANASDESPYEQLIGRFLVATASFPRPMPHYASGFWQCKLRYRSQAEVLEAAQGYVNRSLPLSVIVIDAGNWAELGDFAFDPKCFPDPAGMVSQLRAMGVELMVSLWPHAGALSANFPYMLSHGLLTHNASGQFLNESIPWMPWPPGPQPLASAVDFLLPEAQAYVSGLLVKNFVAHGVKMFWLDADEPDCALPGQQWWNGRPDSEIVSTYPLGVIKTVRDAFDAQGVSDGWILSRDTWVGGGPLGAAIWSGDIVSTFAELRRQVLVSQNVALSGIYHWTTDVGGFISGVIGNATFEELAVRWFQFGAFCPIFRTHGDRWPGLPDDACGSTGGHTEVWYFNHSDIIEGTLRLRERLRPYVELHLQGAARTGRPLLQPMFYAFGGERASYEAEEQFMFGPEWLVAPVLEEGATQRRVWLPSVTPAAVQRLRESKEALGEEVDGAIAEPEAMVWRHHYTDAMYTGGQWVTIKTALTDFPLFRLMANSSAEIRVRSE